MSDSFISLINEVIKCMENQYSYLSWLGLLTIELKDNFNEISSKISNFGDSRIQPPEKVNQILCDINEFKCSTNAAPNPDHTKTVIISYEDENFDNENCADSTKEMKTTKRNLKPKDCSTLEVKSKKSRKTRKISKQRLEFEKFKTGPKDRPYQCHVCKKCFLTYNSFMSHLHIREYIGKSNYKCKICSKTFGFNNAFKVHLRGHTGHKPYKCEQCGGNFSTATNLKKHQQIHSGKKPYLCNDCGMTFTQSGSLLIHKRRHTGERPFKCDICDEGFVQSSYLTAHKLRKHTETKPFMCEMCSRGFIRQHALSVHMRSHTGDRPYCCDVCSCKFTTSGHLKRHQNSHKHKKLITNLQSKVKQEESQINA